VVGVPVMASAPPLLRVVAGDAIRGYQAESETVATVEVAAAAEIAFVLVVAGLMCLALRLSGHGTAWTLPIAALLLALGVALLALLPVGPGGAMMLALAAAAVVFELLVPGFGVHALAAGISTLLAGLYLTGAPPAVHPGLVVPVAVLVAVGAFLAGRHSWRFRRDRPFDASGGLVGRGAVVLTAGGAEAYGVVSGQLWRLRAEHGALHEGGAVRVIEVHDDWLLVRPARNLLTT
jgi:membrane-bound ClpP family serine protease